MKPVRPPNFSRHAEDTDGLRFGASPRSGFSTLSAGRHRRLSMDGEALGCLSLLVAGEHAERPRAFPSPGEVTASCVHAHSTVHLHRPRAVLSSPDNDELQGQQVEVLSPRRVALKSIGACVNDHTAFPSIDAPIPPTREIPKAVISPADELLYVGERNALMSDGSSSCSTSSVPENNVELLPLSNQSMDVKLPPILTKQALNEKRSNSGLPLKSRYEQSGNEENLASSITTGRLAKTHSGSQTDPSWKSSKQQPVSQQFPKRSAIRVLRPWY